MTNSAKQVVDTMFTAFKNGDVEGFIETVSDNTVWIYHGTQIIPKGTFEKKAGVRKFVNNIFNKTELLRFEPKKFIVEGNMVVVLGEEHQRIIKSGRELKQKWVQIYTVKNNLITGMEEFATSEEVN